MIPQELFIKLVTGGYVLNGTKLVLSSGAKELIESENSFLSLNGNLYSILDFWLRYYIWLMAT